MVVGGAFSFDWALVQEPVARFTRICTYDPSGTAWSDSVPQGKALSCIDRVEEIHRLQQASNLQGPYILVGYSIGGLYARLYAQRYPQDVLGIMLVDHAFTDVAPDANLKAPVSPNYDSPPVLISAEPIAPGLEDDENFRRLPPWAQQMHSWAMANHPVRPTAALAEQCADLLNQLTGQQPFPLAAKPLVIISTENETPGYQLLQKKLLSLSRNSKQIVAHRSSHAVIINQPEIVVEGIRQVANAIRNGRR